MLGRYTSAQVWLRLAGQKLPVVAESFYMNSRSTEGYKPPENRAELELRYVAGERHFPNTDLSGESLVGIKLDGADFEKNSWFFDADFSGASLRGYATLEQISVVN
jgi:uncharacterized protein YjbI with pentapeptide repeats